jgi:hypothetical protein
MDCSFQFSIYQNVNALFSSWNVNPKLVRSYNTIGCMEKYTGELGAPLCIALSCMPSL